MATKCENCPLRSRDFFHKMNREDVDYMQRFKVGEMVIDPGTAILTQGSNSPQLFTVLRGMGIRYKTLPDGKRQVINFVFPGDFLGLQAGLMSEMGHSVESTTPMTLCVFDRREFWNFFKSNPNRAYDLTWIAAVEEHFLGEALTSVGQRSAFEAIAWALMRVYQRGDALAMVQDGQMRLPYRQQDLADALGLSLVHTNKTLAKLRENQVASWSDGRLVVNDLEKLASIAQVELSDAVPSRPIL